MNAVGQPALVRGDLLYELGIVLDEAMEFAGWTLLAVGLWDAALAVRVSVGDPRTSRGATAVQLLRDLNE